MSTKQHAFAVVLLVVLPGCGGGSAPARLAGPVVSPAPPLAVPPSGPPIRFGLMRGATAGTELREQDVADFAASGANLLRLGFAARPLMAVDPPHAFDEGAFAYLGNVLDWCEPRGVRVVIDPHRFPGTRHPWTMLGDDPFWSDFRWHDLAIRLWEEIARRNAGRDDVIAGYDLLNEPEVRREMIVGSPGDLNQLYRRMVAAIRQYDRRHTIVLAAPRYFHAGRMHPYQEGLELLEVPDDSNLVFETHTYDPMAFTHQGLEVPVPLVRYPGTIDGERWDRGRLDALHQPIVDFQRRTGRSILLGEFSCPRWIGDTGNVWLEDVIEIAEAHGWSWAYHAWREASIWDPEKSNSARDDETRYPSTPRLQLLRSYWFRNGE